VDTVPNFVPIGGLYGLVLLGWLNAKTLVNIGKYNSTQMQLSY
jgi:hypothetical protein